LWVGVAAAVVVEDGVAVVEVGVVEVGVVVGVEAGVVAGMDMVRILFLFQIVLYLLLF
jgi:hypothetical protein